MSVASQSLPPDEIIVSNDYSTDDTVSVLQKLTETIPSLSYFTQSSNLGITANTNYCLRAAKGDIIIRLDSDDMLAPDYILKLSKLLTENTNVGYAHAAVQEIDENGIFLKRRSLFRKRKYETGDEALLSALNGFKVAANIIMFRKEALEKVSFLQSKANFAEDYHLTASISAAGFGNIYSDEILSYYRVWADTGKKRNKRKLAEVMGLRLVFEDVMEKAFKQRDWSPKKILQARENFACRHADCLSWDIYNTEEKEVLKKELLRLSPSLKVRITIWMYQHHLSKLLLIKNNIIAYFKKPIKYLLVKFYNKSLQ